MQLVNSIKTIIKLKKLGHKTQRETDEEDERQRKMEGERENMTEHSPPTQAFVIALLIGLLHCITAVEIPDQKSA